MDAVETTSENSATVAPVANPETPVPNNIEETSPSSSGVKRKLEGDEDNHKNKRENSEDSNSQTTEDTSPFLHERTALQEHIINNNIPMITLILEQIPNIINMDLPNLNTPLMLAISQYPKTKEAFNFLINNESICIFQEDEKNGCIPLVAAIKDNNLEVIQRILDKHIAKDKTNPLHLPLTKAVEYRKPDGILLIFNAKINNQKPATVARGYSRVLREIFTQMQPQFGQDEFIETELDVALIQFDIPDAFEKLTTESCPTREQLIARILNPIRKRRNILTFAVEQKSTNFIDYLLSLDVLNDVINVKDKSNDTALSVALKNNDLDLAQLLLQKGASLNVASANANTIFTSIVEADNFDAIKLLTGFAGGDIPLIPAVKNNNRKLVEYLLDKGAKVNGTWNGYSPLTAAIHYSNLLIVEVLINGGADVNRNDASGRSPLNVAIEGNKADFVSYVIDKNANINAADGCGFTPSTQAVKANNLNLIRLLCDKGSHLNAEDDNGHTPLTYAAALNHEEILLYLINEREVDVNTQGWFGSTALLRAIDNKNLEVAKALISKGANVSGGDWRGRKPLVRAVETDNIPMIQLLLENNNSVEETNISINWLDGADPKAYSPLCMAVALNKREIVQLFLQHDTTSNNTKIHALCEAIECGNVPLIELLLQNGVRSVELDSNGKSALQKAIEKDGLELVELLSRHDEIQPADIFTEACARNASNLLTHYLLNIDVDTVDSKGYTAMSKCVQNANLAMIKYLYANKADVNRTDGNGFTPLTKALQINNFYAVELLVQAGADVSLADGNNVKPLAKAVEIDNLTLIQLLINHDKRNEQPFSAKAECPVCYVSLRQSQVYSTICGHMFCKDCLMTVCRTSGICPTCRQAVPRNSIHPLFI